MRLVDIKFIPTVAQPYFKIPQPMVVYHSTEEFNEAMKSTVHERAESFGQFFDIIQKHKINLVYSYINRFVEIGHLNLWIKTVDKFVPDYADKYGKIFYKTGDDGQAIPTDGCWIWVFCITPTPSRFVLYTSAGINTIGLTKWQPTGAVRTGTFLQECIMDNRSKSQAYEARLKRILDRKKPDVKFIRLAMAMFSSDSESFLDIDKAVKTVFNRSVKQADAIKLLESQAFREAFMSVIKTLFPTLAPAIRAAHTPEQLAEMLKTLWGIASSSKDVDKMLKVFDKIKEVGYEESTTIESSIPGLPMLNQLSGGSKTAELVMPNPEDYTKNVDEAEDEALEETKEDLDYPDSFIMLDDETDRTEKETK